MRHPSALALLVGCGGGEGGVPTRAITVEEVRPLCEANCEHIIVDCGDTDEDLAECTARCVDGSAGFARRDATEIFYECAAQLACTEGDDACLALVEPLEIHLEWEAGCRANLGTCPEFPADIACDATDEVRGFIRIIAPEIVTEMVACLDGSDCDSQIACVNAVLGPFGLTF